MVQRKVPNKIGIKTHHHKSDTRLINLRPSSPSSSSISSSQTHEKMKKIMKKSRSIKRSIESLPPFKKMKPQQLHADKPGSTPSTPQKQSPNYMKSTSSFEARKEQSPKTPPSKYSRNSVTNDRSTSGVKGSRTSSLKTMKTLTKTPNFKPLRCSKKVIFCEDVDAQRATCSSTLKESKFPNYMQLDPGGTESDGTSAIKVCPYTYCSLNGHHHAHVPPLKSFLSARRRALKSQKGFKLGCLSRRQSKPNGMKFEVTEPVITAPEDENTELFVGDQDLKCSDKDVNENFNDECFSPCQIKLHETKFDVVEPVISGPEEENTEFFVGDQYLECSDMDFEEGYCSDSGLKLQELDEDKIVKTSVERLYDEESVSSGAYLEEDGDSAWDCWYEQMKINQDYGNYDAFEETEMSDELKDQNGDEKINYQKEETFQESKESNTVPDSAEKVKDETEKIHTTIIYNIIQFNISVFVNGEKTEHSETDKTVIVKTPATCVDDDKMKIDEAMEEQDMSDNEENQMVAGEELQSIEQLSTTENHGNLEHECNETSQLKACNYSRESKECNDSSQSNSMDGASVSDVKVEITSETDNSLHNVKGCKKLKEETNYDSLEFNPRGPNFLPETPNPDAETVDLRHQMMDERKNAEEWMVDFALQQAVTTLAPARNKKVALLVEAFEKVMPPDPLPTNRRILKAFTNSRPMQACS